MWYSRVWYYDPPDSRRPRAPSLYGVGLGAGVYADFPKKNSGPAIVVSRNGPKNQNTWGAQGGSPWRFFSPFLCVKKGGTQARPIFAGRVGVCPRI